MPASGERAAPGSSASEACGCEEGPRGCCDSRPGQLHDPERCIASQGVRDQMARHDAIFHAPPAGVEDIREVSPGLWTSGPSLVELDAYGTDPREQPPGSPVEDIREAQ